MKSPRGYSLIEVLIAVFIFTFVILGISRLYYYSFSAENRNKEYYYAVKLAEEKILLLRNTRDQIIQGNPGLVHETLKFEISKNEIIEYQRISRISVISIDRIHVQVKVLWKAMKRGDLSEYKLETFI